MKKLFRVTYHQDMVVYAEDIDEAKELFTENMDECGTYMLDLMAMEIQPVFNVPVGWGNSIPFGDDVDDRTVKEISFELARPSQKGAIAFSVLEE